MPQGSGLRPLLSSQRRRVMKRLLCFLVSVSLLLSLSSCTLPGSALPDTDRLVSLPDEELTVVLLIHLGMEDFDSLNEAQQVVYTAAALELEVLNGGLVQFLSNEASHAAPYVLEALEKIGATEHHQLLNTTLAANGVDLTDLTHFVTEDLEAFSKLYDQYDFEAFDAAYLDLPSMTDYIRSYIRSHADFF